MKSKVIKLLFLFASFFLLKAMSLAQLNFSFSGALNYEHGFLQNKYFTGSQKTTGADFEKLRNNESGVGALVKVNLIIDSIREIQFQLGFSQWTNSNVLPVSVNYKRYLRRKIGVVIGAGYSIGKYHDQYTINKFNEQTLKLPEDIGECHLHWLVGFEYIPFQLGKKSTLGFSTSLNNFLLTQYYIKNDTFGGPQVRKYNMWYNFLTVGVVYKFKK